MGIHGIDSRRRYEKLSSAYIPASQAAIPREINQAQVYQAAQFANMMQPTADNIFTIGRVAVKAVSVAAISGNTSRLGTSSWGF
ncbi:MAG: hypothetical protein AB7F43_14775 [Bacteriovoracia bacterium]